MNSSNISRQIISDDFCRSFKDAETLYDFVSQISESDEWISSHTDNIEAIIVPDMPLLYANSCDFSTLLGREISVEGSTEAVQDTGTRTKLGLVNHKDGSDRCLLMGITGVTTLAQRAGIAAPGPAKVYDNNRSEYRDILNICKKYQKKKLQLLIRGEKVRAVNSACGGNGYAVLDQSQLLSAMRANLDANFPGNELVAGFWSHELLHVEWSAPAQADALLKDYKNALTARYPGRDFSGFVPIVVFSTSDTADRAATVTARLRNQRGDQSVAIGSAMSVVHKNNKTVADFEFATTGIFSRFTDRVRDLTDLAKIDIVYPESTLRNIMQSYRLRKKHIEKAADALSSMYAPGDCTAHDVYFAMNDVLFDLEQEDISVADEYAECIARALHLSPEAWKAFDRKEE